MGACGDFKGMDSETFAKHIKDEAKLIRDLVAEIASEEVSEDAKEMQAQVTYQGGGDAEKAPDHGYSELLPSQQQRVDDYRSNYGIDLLTFDETAQSEVYEELKNEHLTWIVEQFDRLENLPDPKASEPVTDALTKIAGDGELVGVTKSDTEGEVSDKFEDNTSTAESLLNSVVFAKVGPIGDAVAGWTSATADMFKNNFLPEIPAAAANQMLAAKTLRNMIASHQGMLNAFRESIDGIVHDSKTAVESHERSCGASGDAGGDSSIKATIFLVATILSVVAGPLAVPAAIMDAAAAAEKGDKSKAGTTSLTSSTSKTISLASGVTTALKAGTGADKAEDDLGDGDLDETVENMRNAVTKAFKKLDEGYDELTNKGLAVVTDDLHNQVTLFIADRPDEIADAGTGNSEKGKEDILKAVDEK